MITNILKALYIGQQLDSVAKWKMRGAATAALTSLMAMLVGAAVAMGWISQELISTETLATVSAGIVAIVNIVLSYLQVATSKAVGIKPKSKSKNHFTPE